MIERLLIAAALIAASVLAYRTFQARHRARITLRTRSDAVMKEAQPALLYFWSRQCVPCVTQAQFLQQLPQQMLQQIKIEKIDAEEEQEMAARYGVFTLPTTMFVDRQGSVRHVNYGLTPVQKLVGQLESVL